VITEYKTTERRRERQISYANRLREMKLCINASPTGGPSKRSGRVHGAVFKSGRCHDCYLAKLESEKRKDGTK
jgi:hypothetical protein